MIEGFEAGDFPELGGYQRIFAKPTAQILLLAKEEDPLLVTWRYGLGKSAAFTSDLGRVVGDSIGWVGPNSVVSSLRWHVGPCAGPVPRSYFRCSLGMGKKAR